MGGKVLSAYRELPNAWFIATPNGLAIILRIASMMRRWSPNFPNRHISVGEPPPKPIRRRPRTAGTPREEGRPNGNGNANGTAYTASAQTVTERMATAQTGNGKIGNGAARLLAGGNHEQDYEPDGEADTRLWLPRISCRRN